ncbi:hypothetical protein M2347_001345 [Chryseobacterium sp. H1D6B]|uniref:hypothetical protein n=1 Tax=Chryseobacterium sp. H1D6B TaxID=2940588 RepID=UPI0015CD9030|nr:hypothetical protein [Chryseobacterium sp. H1D6B]MDH6251618.1 hypothetical protein [Chryseobacterium sp. H1D6B]
MQNIQDLKEKIFFESKNIIDILDKINNVDELLSKQDLVEELANRISFLRLLEKNIEYFVTDTSFQISENQQYTSFVNNEFDSQESNNEVTEEEAIFNNEFNEIDESENGSKDYHENFISFIEEEKAPEIAEIRDVQEEYLRDGSSENTHESSFNKETTEEEAIFNNQLNEIAENDYHESIVKLAEEEKIPENSQEEKINYKTTEEEALFNNQLNEIDEFENEPSDYTESSLNSFDEQDIQNNFEPEVTAGKEEKPADNFQKNSDKAETIPSIFDTESIDDDEILMEENEDEFVSRNVKMEQGEMATETSNVQDILSEIKYDAQIEEKQEETAFSEENDRRKIVEIEKDKPEIDNDRHASDESFENLEAYNQEKKIKLSNIKGLKAVQTLFDDDPLEREVPKEKVEPVIKEETGSLLKTNIPTEYMEAGKSKPEFRLDLNDRIAFSKTLFAGSQSELNEVVAVLNRFKTLDEAKEYLSEQYYRRNWKKVDEYAQRLWVLVENKFL